MEQVSHNQRPSETPKLMYKVSEAAEALSLSRSKTYELIREGRIPAIRIGGVIRVPVAALRALAEAAPRHDEPVDPVH